MENEWQERPRGLTVWYVATTGWFVLAVINLGVSFALDGWLRVIFAASGFFGLLWSWRSLREALALRE